MKREGKLKVAQKPKEIKYELRNLSKWQYGTLKFIRDNRVTLDYLRHAHATTLGSIAYWGWIAAVGSGPDSEVMLTKAGHEQVRNYEQASMNERSHEGELTNRCMRLLKHARKVLSIPDQQKSA